MVSLDPDTSREVAYRRRVEVIPAEALFSCTASKRRRTMKLAGHAISGPKENVHMSEASPPIPVLELDTEAY